MRIYTYSKARAKLAAILKESNSEEVIIQRRKGDQYAIVPRVRQRRSPFDVAHLKKTVSRKDILAAIHESRGRE